MTRLRFTLAQLMAIVIPIGVGLAALRSASVVWTSAVFTLTVLVLSSAVLGAMAFRGRARMTWAGFALFGWIYLATVFGPWSEGHGVKPPPYLTRWLLDYTLTRYWYANRIDTAPPGEVLFPTPAFTVGMGGGISGAMTPGQIAGSPAPVVFVNMLQFRRIGHCLGAILFGLVGAVVGRAMAARNDQPNP
jgi:hypothetical protein